MKKLTLLVLLNSFIYSQNCHEPSGWCYDVSTQQAFYIFETVTIDGELAEWESGDENDVIGSFCGDTMVGFIEAQQNWTTVPTMGNNGDFPGYCLDGDNPTFKIYDYSEDEIKCASVNLGLNSMQIEDGCQECVYSDEIYSDPCWCYSQINGWENNQLFFFNTLEANYIPDCNGDICGDAFYDDCGVCSGGNSGHYPDSDKDCNGDCFGNAYDNECGCVEGNTNLEYDYCYGCMDGCAENYDPDAILDDGSCLTIGDTIYYNLHTGNNLKGYNGAANSITDAIPDQFESYIIQILGEGVAAQQLTPGQWVGSLSSLINGDGYWIKVSQPIEGFYFE